MLSHGAKFQICFSLDYSYTKELTYRDSVNIIKKKQMIFNFTLYTLCEKAYKYFVYNLSQFRQR